MALDDDSNIYKLTSPLATSGHFLPRALSVLPTSTSIPIAFSMSVVQLDWIRLN